MKTFAQFTHLKKNKPIAFIVKAQNNAELGIDRISLLFANDHANGINPGIVDVYALDQLPYAHRSRKRR